MMLGCMWRSVVCFVTGGPGKGCAGFRGISLNVEREESSIKEDAGMQDVHYSEVWRFHVMIQCCSIPARGRFCRSIKEGWLHATW